MKVCFVSPYLPGPPKFGGQRRIHGLMTALAESHEVSIVALVDGSEESSEEIRDTQKYCRNIITVPSTWHRVAGRSKRALQLRSMLSSSSWEHLLYHRPAFQRALDGHLSGYRYDIINCEFAFMGSYQYNSWKSPPSGPRKTRLVLDEHNVEYDVLRRTASATSLDRKFFNAMNWRKLRREETRAWGRFDGCTFTSVRDEEIVRRGAPDTRTAVIPNGVDVDLFKPMAGAARDPMTLLFFGAINYFPNTDGILFFLRDVLPILKARYPSLKVRIVGPGAPESVQAAASEGVEVTGFVEDLRSEIDRATVVIAPLRIGGGTRLKILEAMAVARPIVSTRLGAEGLEVTDERDILLADEPEAFAHAVGRVLDDRGLAARLGKAARQTAEARYSWRAAAAKLVIFYRELLEAG